MAALRRLFPDLAGPADVTPAVAEFPRRALATPYARSPARGAATYKRSPVNVNALLRTLRVVWSRKQWGRPGGYVASNPWAGVPDLNRLRGKRVRVPADGAEEAFFAWLASRYPGWELPGLFVTVKLLAGCRTFDLCQARTADGLVMRAETTKSREARTVPLPPDVLADLRRLAGPGWVWERAAVGCRERRPGRPDGHAGRFAPVTWKRTVESIFKKFNDGRPEGERLLPHDLRARAMTLVAAAMGSVDATAQAMGVDPSTARHYTEARRVFDGRAILRAT